MGKYPKLPRFFYFIDGNDGFYGPYINKPNNGKIIKLNLSEVNILPDKHIAVISLNKEDFLKWKRDEGFGDEAGDRVNRFKRDDKIYLRIAHETDLRGWCFDKIMETPYANKNKHYNEIITYSKITLKSNYK